MAHWLADIAKIFNSESDDLADLAKAVGYDPQAFYSGTLSPEQIDRLVLKIDPPANVLGEHSVDGDFGPATASFPPTFDILSAPVFVFEDEIALQEAFFTEALKTEFVAVIRYSNGQREDLDVSSLVPVLEIVQSRGGRVALLVDASIENLVSPVAVVANFVESAARNGQIGRLKDGDQVVIDSSERTLSSKGVLRNRRSISAGKQSTFDSVLSLDDEASQLRAFARFLAVQVHVIEELSETISSGQTKSLLQAYTRIFDNMCRYIADSCRRMFGRHQEADAWAIGSDLPKLSTVLRRCSRRIGLRGARFAAIHGYRTTLALFEVMDKARTRASPLDVADVTVAIGDMYYDLQRLENAIAEYRRADFLLRGVSGRERFKAMEASSRVSLKLAICLAADRRFHDADNTLDEAEEFFGKINPQSEREIASLGQFFHQRSLVADALGRARDALYYIERALELYLHWAERNHSPSTVNRMAEAYQSRAILLEKIEPGEMVARAWICVFYLRLKLAERTDFKGAASQRLAQAARLMGESFRMFGSSDISDRTLGVGRQVSEFINELEAVPRQILLSVGSPAYSQFQESIWEVLPPGVAVAIANIEK